MLSSPILSQQAQACFWRYIVTGGEDIRSNRGLSDATDKLLLSSCKTLCAIRRVLSSGQILSVFVILTDWVSTEQLRNHFSAVRHGKKMVAEANKMVSFRLQCCRRPFYRTCRRKTMTKLPPGLRSASHRKAEDDGTSDSAGRCQDCSV